MIRNRACLLARRLVFSLVSLPLVWPNMQSILLSSEQPGWYFSLSLSRRTTVTLHGFSIYGVTEIDRHLLRRRRRFPSRPLARSFDLLRETRELQHSHNYTGVSWKWFPGRVNPVSLLPLAARRAFTQPRKHSLAGPCRMMPMSSLSMFCFTIHCALKTTLWRSRVFSVGCLPLPATWALACLPTKVKP